MRLKPLATVLLLAPFLLAACTDEPEESPPIPLPSGEQGATEYTAEHGTLVITVTDPDGAPLEGVALEIAAQGDAVPVDFESAPLTSPEGEFRLSGALGVYEVATVNEGGEADSAEAEVAVGETAEVELVFDQA